MKNILILLVCFLAFGIQVEAQKGKAITITSDTVKGAETIYMTTGQIIGEYANLSIQALCTDSFGGTSDGTIILQGSIDGTSFANLIDKDGFLYCPNDTFTIVPNGVALFTVKDNPYNYYRLKITGTSGDTTKLTVKYLFK